MKDGQLEVCDIVEYGTDYQNQPKRYRITHFLKRMEDDLDSWKPDDIGSEIVRDLLLRSREVEREKRLKIGLPANKRYYLKYCKPEEATHVSLGTTHAPINECKFIKTVEWKEELIEKTRKDAVSNFWLNIDNKYWEWE